MERGKSQKPPGSGIARNRAAKNGHTCPVNLGFSNSFNHSVILRRKLNTLVSQLHSLFCKCFIYYLCFSLNIT